jgi:Na+:H+ antiporter, NhaA family
VRTDRPSGWPSEAPPATPSRVDSIAVGGPGDAVEPLPLVRRLTRPFEQFAHNKASSGILLLAAALTALVWANSPWAESYYHLWETSVTIGATGFGLTQSLHHWINDGLMAVFFFVVGLEIKREVLVGELSSIRQATLPIVGAIGGMLVPALLYAAFAVGTPAASGWGIPMATDIAFALGIITLLGDRVPSTLKIFLAALAIVDDIGAVMVIAFFYTASIDYTAVLVAAGLFGFLIMLNRGGFNNPLPYAIVGIALWVAVLSSGVHATIAGVLLAVTIPARTRIDGADFLDDTQRVLQEFDEAGGDVEDVITNQSQQDAIFALEQTARAAQSPLLRLERQLHGTVAFAIMPLFALANAGVPLSGDTASLASEPVVLGVVAGLFIGKPLGIAGAAWLAIRTRVAEMPSNTNWWCLVGVSALGGIGFTMSLFIAGLAFADQLMLDAAKVGILAGSLLAGVLGWMLVVRGSRKHRSAVAGSVA